MAEMNAAIFDFGGVLTTSPMSGIYAYEDEVGIERGSLLRLVIGEEVDGDDPWHKLERGELMAKDFWQDVKERAASELGAEISLNALTISFATGFKVREQVIGFVTELSEADVPLALLTNNVKEFGQVWRSMVPVDDLFDVIVDSSEVGMRKPDPRIYEITLERVGSHPKETVFVDDTLENVSAAEALGMTGIHFGEEVDESEVVARLRELFSEAL